MSNLKKDDKSQMKPTLFPKFRKKISGFISDESGKIANDDVQKILLSTIAITGIIGITGATTNLAHASDDADDCDDDGDDCDDGDDGDDAHSNCVSSFPHSSVAAVNTNHPVHCSASGHANVPSFAEHASGPVNGHYSKAVTNPAASQVAGVVNTTSPYGAHCNTAGTHANVPSFTSHNNGIINGHYNQTISNPGSSMSAPVVNTTVYGSHSNSPHTNSTVHSNVCT